MKNNVEKMHVDIGAQRVQISKVAKFESDKIYRPL